MSEDKVKTTCRELNFMRCIFADSYVNDPEQRNYFLYKCKNPENEGGETSARMEDFHDARTYSCWYKNEGMRYGCWSKPSKIINCPMALAYTEPEINCEKFKKEKTSPLKALITKEGLKEQFYQPDELCISCENCLD